MLKALVLMLVIGRDPELVAIVDELARRIDERQETEQAAFVVRAADGSLSLVRWPSSARVRSASYFGAIPEGTVATIHTHPYVAERPSRQDIEESRRLRLPFLVVTRRTISLVEPATGRVIIMERDRARPRHREPAR